MAEDFTMMRSYGLPAARSVGTMRMWGEAFIMKETFIQKD